MFCHQLRPLPAGGAPVYVAHLSLASFRNYASLELPLQPGLLLFQGDNAQGKTNLVEALYLLSTTRSHRAENERELLGWSSLDPWARAAAEVETARGRLKVDVVLQREEARVEVVRKRFRIGGIARPAAQVVGVLAQALFSPEDIDLVGGAPALRRRFLDALGSQVDPRYLASLQRYQRVLTQRNHLLRLLGEGKGGSEELEFWDRELVASGSYLIEARKTFLLALQGTAREAHAGLGAGELEISYLPSVMVGDFAQALLWGREREIGAGMTLVGPHRDDLGLKVGGVDMGVFGSRGQQRTVALALRLAEAQYLREVKGESPLLLLDDVFSELDARRRERLLQVIQAYQQVFITTTELERLPPALPSRGTVYRVSAGSVSAL